MKTSAKHIALNLAISTAAIVIASAATAHPLAAISCFVAAALLAMLARDYRKIAPLPLAPANPSASVRPAYAAHRLAA
ncbi:hypothetical protein K0B96_07945 [Horticoccus luteus]|uniref:Uncharacterized protein n=1 Tax=Horticoccus luteus TaxID=2862869 RepID=A0A8F9XLB7_9BACT|nr:hypothetical protein [Horticoccus luteus]QYM80528.1 hypothetical protein K0B96_07945 [Horticoccus luteus]